VKQVIIFQGKARAEEVPAPLVEPGTVLVETVSSCISIGTEMAGVRVSSMPLWKRAVKKPENIKKVLDHIQRDGLSKTVDLIQSKAASGQPTGYSLAGRVLAVGPGVQKFSVGDRVACAGAQCAYHAEVVRVPENLCVPIPDSVGLEEASTVALGAIALQGVRRTQPTLGETVVVIGLGVLGQITVQLLRANGCKVIGLDLDSARAALALQFGAQHAFSNTESNVEGAVANLTDGYGADATIITAATPSDVLMSQAFKITRKKGRVVLVGDVGLNLNRADFYEKEIDFFISSSYGPGRYDQYYEEKGLDYPLPFVRWTENRNMLEYLNQISLGALRIRELVSQVYPIEEAEAAFESLKNDGPKPLMVLLKYNGEAGLQKQTPKTILTKAATPKDGKVRMGLIGAGSFAKAMHLPNIKQNSNLFHLQAVATRTGHLSAAVAKQYEAQYAATDYREILQDSEIQAVLIATRHNLHAELALAALKSGKHVLLEKPLALNRDELKNVSSFFEGRAESPILLTGFNRRFSSHIQEIKNLLRSRKGPMMINYRMNAGYIPAAHWTQGSEGGGRNIGEACHIYDLFTCLTDQKVLDVMVQCLKPSTSYYLKSDNFVSSFTFADGSVATLLYTASGNTAFSKETMEIHCEGLTVHLDDYKTTDVYAAGKGLRQIKKADKGQERELIAFGEAIQKGKEWPIPLWQQIQATEMSFQVEDQLQR